MIRAANLSDAAALAELAERTFRDAFAAQNTAADMDAYIARTYGPEHQRLEIEDPNITTLVVEDDGALIGFAQVKHNDADVELARLYVDRGYHGKGIAHDLMSAVFDVGRKSNMQTVWLGVWEHNPRAIRFYEKCGFRVTGSHPFLLGSDLQTDLIMTREL